LVLSEALVQDDLKSQVELHLDMFASAPIYEYDFWSLDLERLLTHGKLYEPKRVYWILGVPQFCHTNSAEYWNDHPRTSRIVTGYALSNNYWFRHTWLVGKRGGNVWESTVRFQKYFGYELEGAELIKFVLDNTLGWR
jgi:hypothetical protein